MLKMQVALDELMKIKELPYFTDSVMKVKEIARKIGSAVHAKPRLERVAWRRPFHPLGTRLAPRSLRRRKCRNLRALYERRPAVIERRSNNAQGTFYSAKSWRVTLNLTLLRDKYRMPIRVIHLTSGFASR